MNKQKYTVLTVVGFAVIAGAAFFGGMKFQESKQPGFTRQGTVGSMSDLRNGVRTGGVGRGFRPVAGEILRADDTSVTVKLEDGGSRIVILTDKTTINKAEEGSRMDLKPGEKIAVYGTENTDGSVSAQNIQLNPVLRFQTPASGSAR